MAISRSAAGTAKSYDDVNGVSTVTKTGVTAATGDTVVVQVVCSGGVPSSPPEGVTWNGQALTKRVDAGTSEVNASQWTLDNVTGATGSVVVDTADTVPFGVNVAVVVVSGAAAAATDVSTGTTGTSTTPSSGNTSTTSQANALALGLVGWHRDGSINEGSWGGSFTDDQASSNSISGGYEGDLSTGYLILSATGAYSAAKSGATSADWAATILVLKEAASTQTSTPGSVGVSGGVSTPTSVKGQVASAPASVGASSSVSAPTSAPGPVSSTPDSVGIQSSVFTDASDVVFPQTSGRDPTTVTSLSFLVVHPTSPADLGDDDLMTFVDSSSHGTGTGTASVVAATLEDPPHSGEISHVIFGARGAWTDPGGALSVSSHRFLVTVGGVTDGPASSAVFPVWGPDAVNADAGTILSDPMTEKPGGGAWTWADVDAMQDLTVLGDYEVTGTAMMRVAELWAEVWGEVGPEPDVIPIQAPFGAIHNPGNLGGIHGPGQFNGLGAAGALGKVRLRFQMGG